MQIAIERMGRKDKRGAGCGKHASGQGDILQKKTSTVYVTRATLARVVVRVCKTRSRA